MRKHIPFFFLLGCWLMLAILFLASPDQKTSFSERRSLAQFPKLSVQTVTSGRFMEQFETYAADQFPGRDTFRALKAGLQRFVLQQKDVNGIYVTKNADEETVAAAMLYPQSDASVSHALQCFDRIYATYLEGTNTKLYAAIIPDKNSYLAKQTGHLSLDYDDFSSTFEEGMTWAQWIDLTDTLSADCYYRTDPHWDQTKLLPVAQKLLAALGHGGDAWTEQDVTLSISNTPFSGVYCGQTALPLTPDTLTWYTNDVLESCEVSDANGASLLYDTDALSGKDPYSFFCSGSVPLLTITNPNAQTDRELVIFRDSFGSSIAPLLVPAYRSITLIDTRYMSPSLIGDYVTFADQDVLFLYSTVLLNDSSTLR